MARKDKPSANDSHVRRAVSRLEDAIDELVASAGDSAAGHIERAAERVRHQMALRRSAGERPKHRPRYRPRRRREPAWLWSDEPRSAKLYRDKKAGKLFGVCAGIARYYGIEPWIVRLFVITGVIFSNGIVLLVYLAAGVVLDAEPAGEKASSDREADAADGKDDASRPPPPRYATPSPRQQLRVVDAEFDEMELRLRRMETHVTSGRYELQREFGRIGDSAGSVN